MRGVASNMTETGLWRIQKEVYFLTAVARIVSLDTAYLHEICRKIERDSYLGG